MGTRNGVGGRRLAVRSRLALHMHRAVGVLVVVNQHLEMTGDDVAGIRRTRQIERNFCWSEGSIRVRAGRVVVVPLLDGFCPFFLCVTGLHYSCVRTTWHRLSPGPEPGSEVRRKCDAPGRAGKSRLPEPHFDGGRRRHVLGAGDGAYDATEGKQMAGSSESDAHNTKVSGDYL